MNWFAILSLVSFMVLTIISTAGVMRNSKSLLNWLYSGLIGTYALQTLIEFGYRQAQTAAQAHFWWKLDVIWPLGIMFSSYFVIYFTERVRWLRHPISHILIVVPTVTFIILELTTDLISTSPVRNYWGWSYQLQPNSLGGQLTFIWLVSAYLVNLILTLVYLRNVSDTRKRRQTKFVAVAIFVGIFFCLGEAIIGYLGIAVPQFSGAAFLIIATVFGYAIWKYDMLALTPITVAENIVAAMADALLLVNNKNEIANCNDAACKLLEFKRSSLIGQAASLVFDKSAQMPTLWSDNSPTGEVDKINYIDTRFKTRTGKGIPVWLAASSLRDANGYQIGFLLIARDITERNRREQELRVFKNHLEKLVEQRTSELKNSLEDLKKESTERVKAEKERENLEEERTALKEQLYHAQKLESIGRLAGGVAHDFNNLLFVINTYSEGFLSNLNNRDPLYHDFKEIHQAAARATTLTQQLLAFSRKQITRPVIVDPNDTIKQLQRMLKRLIGEHIFFNVVPGINVGKIKIDPGQLDQVMMNLAVNAKDAMTDGGTITVEINQTQLSKADCHNHRDVKPGTYVVIKFTDNGNGMDDETKSKIFDPFFSTKAPGKGTGLGLSTIYGIVKQNGGFIEVSSRLGCGTTFTLYFPRYSPDLEDSLIEGDLSILKGDETILLVEDEDQVRHLAARLLRQLGYNVIETSSASEATSVFHECRNQIDLLFTDIVMPGMNGKQLSRMLGITNPKLKVLFMSGYNEHMSILTGDEWEATSFLAKPLTSEALLKRLREILNV